MNDPKLESLIENEKEWRRYLVQKLENIERTASQMREDFGAMKAWSLVFRLSGTAAFAILLVWIESKFKV